MLMLERHAKMRYITLRWGNMQSFSQRDTGFHLGYCLWFFGNNICKYAVQCWVRVRALGVDWWVCDMQCTHNAASLQLKVWLWVVVAHGCHTVNSSTMHIKAIIHELLDKMPFLFTITFYKHQFTHFKDVCVTILYKSAY